MSSKELRQSLQAIPDDIDVFVSHADMSKLSQTEEALEASGAIINVFGHYHKGYGYTNFDESNDYTKNFVPTGVNVSSVGTGYRPTNYPVVFDVICP